LIVATKKNQPRGLRKFSRETIAELRKVSWPTRSEAIQLTRVVLIVIFVMGAFLGLLDYAFSQLFGLILGA
jgi:preprotein translocase subunit SecE